MPFGQKLYILKKQIVLDLSEKSVARVSSFYTVIYYNASNSVPKGFYVISHKAPKRGGFVLVNLPTGIADLAETRGYLPKHIPLLKRVEALEGDRVCRSGLNIAINQSIHRRTLAKDSAGRHMPVWQGCIELKKEEYFLISPHAKSFDSRYFGPVRGNHILGVMCLLWTSRKNE